MKHLLTLVQINHYPQTYKRAIGWMLKIAVSGTAFIVIYRAVSSRSFDLSIIQPDGAFGVVTGLVVTMMFVNWGLEAQRWKISLPQECISFFDSLSAVLSGLALNWVMPFTLGDAAGRLASAKNRKHSVVAMLVNRGVMLCLTAIYGAFALSYFTGELVLAIVAGTVLAGVVCVAFFWGRKKKVTPDRRTIFLLLLLSVLRYLIFTLQFYLLIWLFNPLLPGSMIVLGIGWIFLFRSFLPSLFGNFGVREASALLFFNASVTEPSLILAPCLLIWLINTVIPSICGTYCVFKLRVKIAQ